MHPRSGNTIRGNLVLGTIKDMVGKSGFDIAMPASFQVRARTVPGAGTQATLRSTDRNVEHCG